MDSINRMWLDIKLNRHKRWHLSEKIRYSRHFDFFKIKPTLLEYLPIRESNSMNICYEFYHSFDRRFTKDPKRKNL